MALKTEPLLFDFLGETEYKVDLAKDKFISKRMDEMCSKTESLVTADAVLNEHHEEMASALAKMIDGHTDCLVKTLNSCIKALAEEEWSSND